MNSTKSKVRAKSAGIRQFIISGVAQNPTAIAKLAATHFGITRQAVHRHIQRLVEEEILLEKGATRGKRYELRTLNEWEKSYSLTDSLAESTVWGDDIDQCFAHLSKDVVEIWHYCFTEIFNNAIDHSAGNHIVVQFAENAAYATIHIWDDGVGIFKKIKKIMGLSDARHAALELAKGKFTTDSKNHTGEGIFFTSRMLDEFVILSGEVYFSHTHGEELDWIRDIKEAEAEGDTLVRMQLKNDSNRKIEKIFRKFSSDDGDYRFNKTNIPISLAEYGDDKLVSRSQAKRLLVRLDRFDVVTLDFKKTESIGQAFADEIFRVFANRHPQIELTSINKNKAVDRMIRRAKSHD